MSTSKPKASCLCSPSRSINEPRKPDSTDRPRFDVGLPHIPRQAFACLRTLILEVQRYPMLNQQLQNAKPSKTDVNFARLKLSLDISIFEKNRLAQLEFIEQRRALLVGSRAIFKKEAAGSVRPRTDEYKRMTGVTLAEGIKKMAEDIVRARLEVRTSEARQDLVLLLAQQTWIFEDDVKLAVAMYSRPAAPTDREMGRKLARLAVTRMEMQTLIDQKDGYIKDKHEQVKQLQHMLKQDATIKEQEAIKAMEVNDDYSFKLVHLAALRRQSQLMNLDMIHRPMLHVEPAMPWINVDAVYLRTHPETSTRGKKRKLSKSEPVNGRLAAQARAKAFEACFIIDEAGNMVSAAPQGKQEGNQGLKVEASFFKSRQHLGTRIYSPNTSISQHINTTLAPSRSSTWS